MNRGVLLLGTAWLCITSVSSSFAQTQLNPRPNMAAGTALDAPAPGRFVGGLGVSALSFQVPKVEYGTITSQNNGGSIQGSFLVDSGRQTAVSPELSGAFGLPSGLFGQQADVYGKLGYTGADWSENKTQNSGNIWIPSVASITIPGVGEFIGQPFSGVVTHTSMSRSMDAYEGAVGLRVHLPAAEWRVSPSVEMAYQRLNQDDRYVTVQPGSTNDMDTATALDSNYYRLGFGLGATRALSQSVQFFSSLGASLELVRTTLAGSTAGTGGGTTRTVSASDRDSTVSGRGQVRAGLLYAIPDLPVTVGMSAMAQYIGVVPRVIFPQTSTGAFTAAIQPSQIEIENQTQLNFGGGLNATWSF